jgi:hypothetical protein
MISFNGKLPVITAEEKVSGEMGAEESRTHNLRSEEGRAN